MRLRLVEVRMSDWPCKAQSGSISACILQFRIASLIELGVTEAYESQDVKLTRQVHVTLILAKEGHGGLVLWEVI